MENPFEKVTITGLVPCGPLQQNLPMRRSRRKKVASVSKVSAQVIFYDASWPDREVHRVNHACWLNEPSPYVSFDLGTIHHVMVGIFQHKKDGTDGFEPEFTIYGTSPDPNAPLTRYRDRFTENFKIKIRLIVGEHGEFSSEHDFELQHSPGEGHSFGHVSEEEKQRRKAYVNGEFEKLIAEGEEFVTTALIHADWDKLYNDIHEWTRKVSTLISRHFGRPLSSRFYSTTEPKPYPHRISDGRKSFFDNLYTRVENLKEIAREQGAAVSASDISRQKEDVSNKRRKAILKDLSEFAEEAKKLLDNAQKDSRPSERGRDLYIWDAELFEYLSDNLEKTDTALMDDSDLEDNSPPPASRIEMDSFLRRVHSRLVRLNRLIDEISSGPRTI